MKVVSVLLLFLFILFPLTLYAASESNTPITDAELLKIDPVFHPILASKSPADMVNASFDVSRLAVHADNIDQNQNGETVFGVVIRTDDGEALRNAGININTVLPGYATARLTAGELIDVARKAQVEYISPGWVCYPNNDVARGETGAELLHGSYINNTEYKGSGVLVCIIDSGIDWEHKDFRDPLDDTQSRILYLWDMTLTKTGLEQTPEDRDGTNFVGLNYGVEYSQADIENEIDGSPAGFVREEDTNGHGTHVAGSAAGNGAANSSKSYAGMAPEADIIVVKAGNGSFSWSNQINALTYAQQMSETLGKPIVVNMSLGGHSSAHDGTGSTEVAVDNFADAGRVAVISAGNEGNDDIHFSGTVPASSTDNVDITIASYTANTSNNNDAFGIVIWFDDATDVSLNIDPPTIAGFDVHAGSADYYGDDTDGYIYYFNAIDGNYTNGDREHLVYVTDADENNPPADGVWQLTLTNNTGSPVNYHGWLYTESMGLDHISVAGANSDYTVGSPGTANEALTVGAYAARWRWSNSLGSGYSAGTPDASDDIAPFSSIGPRRDGVQKPDITAPGQYVASASSQSITPNAALLLPGEKHRLSQGTSMSSPVTAGTVALMLEANPNLTAAQIKSLITSNAFTDPYTGGSLPDYTWGYGKLDALKVVSEILNSGSTLDREILVYDTWTSENAAGIGAGVYHAVRFTPGLSGIAAGVFLHVYSSNITSPLNVEIWSDNGGLPNTKLGSTVSISQSALLPYSWNYIDLTGAGVNVTSATDYHIVYYFTTGTSFFVDTDDGSVDGRSSINTGSGWSVDTEDYRLRPVIVTGQDALLALKVYLQGPYNNTSHEMSTALYTGGYIPTTSPYTEDARTVSSVPNDVTDWVLVQLRETEGGAAVYSHSAFLRNDGRLVADNGTTTDVPLTVDASDYFIVVKHRNHIEVMSDNAHTLSTSSSTLYDFSTALTQYEGGDAATVETGVYGMYSGNADNSDVTIDADDRVATWNDRNTSGYDDSDCTLTGTVDANDRAKSWNNRNVTTGVPQ